MFSTVRSDLCQKGDMRGYTCNTRKHTDTHAHAALSPWRRAVNVIRQRMDMNDHMQTNRPTCFSRHLETDVHVHKNRLRPSGVFKFFPPHEKRKVTTLKPHDTYNLITANVGWQREKTVSSHISYRTLFTLTGADTVFLFGAEKSGTRERGKFTYLMFVRSWLA